MSKELITADTPYHKGIRAGWLPPEIITVSEYADKYRVLPKTSVEPGAWLTSRTPYLKEIMDNLSVYSPIETIVCMKGTQLGFTEASNNWLCYLIDIAPAPSMIVLPTDAAAKDHAKMKFNPTISAMPRIDAKVQPVRSKTAGSTMCFKEHIGGFVSISGANSGMTFRHKSIKNFIADDVDGWPLDVAGEGDPLGLGVNRTDAYGSRKKIFIISTPTAEIKSRIYKEFLESDQRYYHVPCPFCEQLQPLEWGGKDAELWSARIQGQGDVGFIDVR